MVHHNFLLQHWEEQSGVYLLNLAIIRRRPAQKAVHDIRVAVKKLKSCLRLAHQVTGEKEEKKPDNIQRFFRITGRFRDVDISLSLLKKIGKAENISLQPLNRYLHTMQRATRDMVHAAAGVPYESELGSITLWLTEQLSTVTGEELVTRTEELSTETFREVRDLSVKFTHHAHEIRKKLKQLYYWLKLCPVNPFFDKMQMKILEAALTALGNWHDYFVLQNKIRKFRKEYLVRQTPDHELAKKLEEITAGIQEKWLKDAEGKITALLKPF